MNFLIWFEAAGVIASFALIATALSLMGRPARARSHERHVAGH
jgi:hypothetical protein